MDIVLQEKAISMTPETEAKTIKAKFDMSLLQRIIAASKLWWAMVVTGEIDCIDDEFKTPSEQENTE